MAKRSSQSKTTVPGSIYLRNNRYWWKVQLPGEEQTKARPLKPLGSKFATTDRAVALQIAQNMYQEAIYRGANVDTKEIANISSLISAYLAYVDEYYVDEDGKPTCEPEGIRYSVKPLVELFAGLPVEDFGPLRLIEVRNYMISRNLSRNLINRRIGKITQSSHTSVNFTLQPDLL